MTTLDRYVGLAPSLDVQAHGRVRVVTMNAPDRLNSVDDEMSIALGAVWELLVEDDGADVVILTGAGTAFCAGGHYPDLLVYHEDRDERFRATRRAERLLHSMTQCELPVIAAVNGPAIGLGASLALFCDIVLMSDAAYIADPHVNVGVVAGDGGAVVWPLLAGLSRAKEHLFLGDRIDAAECHRIGLANRVVPAGDVMTAALDLAERLAAQPPQALRGTKRALNLHLQRAVDLVLPFALNAERESFAGPEVRATVERFRERNGSRAAGS